MRQYLLRRTLSVLPVLLGISILVFALIRLVPGDVVQILLGTRTNPETVKQLRHIFGLDRPMTVQYFDWMAGVLRGDLGESLRTGRPVAGDILRRFPATLELTGAAMLLSLSVAIPFGVISAVRQYSRLDYVGSFVSLVGVAMPEFWLGTMLILVFSLYLGWLPPAGFVPLAQDPVANLRYLVLPAVTLGAVLAAVVMRFTRSAMLEVIRQEYIKTARAKGLAERVVIYRHALRNALIPVITVIGIQTGYLLGGAVIIEEIFAWPGIGRLALQGIYQRDYPVVQGTVLFIAALFVLINLVVDVVYGFIDPRIRYD